MSDEFAARRARRRQARWKRPPRILGPWAKLVLSASMIAVSVFIGIILVAKIIKPYQEANRQTVQLAETLQQSDSLAAQNAELERRIAYLKTPGGVASEARRLGYLRPGEYPIVVEGMNRQGEPGQPDGRETPSAEAPFAPPSPELSPMRRFWRHLSGH